MSTEPWELHDTEVVVDSVGNRHSRLNPEILLAKRAPIVRIRVNLNGTLYVTHRLSATQVLPQVRSRVSNRKNIE